MGVSLSTASLASGPFATKHDLVAQRRLESQQRCDTARVRRTIAELEADIALERLGNAAQYGCGPSMQTVRIWQNDCLRSNGRACFGLRCRRCAVQRQGQHRGLADDSRAGSIDSVADPLAVRDDHLRQQALGVGRDVVEIELDERRAGIHSVTYLYPRSKTLALQGDGIDAHMHEHLEIARCLQGDRVTGGVLLHDLAGTWRA